MFHRIAQFARVLGVWSLMLFQLPQAVFAQDEGDTFRSIQGQYFEIVGVDPASVSSVHFLAGKVAETCARYMGKLEDSYPQLIFVALRPSESTESAESEVNYAVRVGEAGFVRVDFRWGADLDMETVCLGLTEAFVKRYSYSHYGADAPRNLKYWPVSALASQVYLSLRPAQIINYQRELRGTGLPDVNALMTLSYDDAIQLGSGREGYWLLSCLREAGQQAREIGRLMEISIAGIDGTRSLERMIQPRGIETPAVTLPDWWEGRMQALLSKDHELYESMDVSLEWLEQLVHFDAYRAEGHEFANLRDLWKLRDEPTLREILTARRDLIRLRLERVNPVYFNAARSLAVLYDTALNGERMHEFIFALTTFLGDYEDMKRLHQQTLKALDRGE